MGLTAALARLARGAPVPVFAVPGHGGRQRVRALALDPRVELVDSPRHASVLLVAGRLPRALYAPALAVHDQLAPPRHTVVWDAGSSPVFPDATVAEDDAAESILGAVPGAGEPPLLLDVDPAPWRGLGPYGHGGKGMTGGTPHGRPLPGRAPDRDGLQLDQLALRVGPFFGAFPPGLALDVKLQGDVVQDVVVVENPFTVWPGDAVPAAGPLAPFETALHAPVAIATLELARARHHLAWLGDALRVQGLAALGHRAAQLAMTVEADDAGRAALARLVRRVEASQVLRWSLPGMAVEPVVTASEGVGPVARAAGHHEDARLLDPAYERLGFEPVTHERGDAAARWRQRMAEAGQALALAAAAGTASTTVTGIVESPRGPITPGSGTPAATLLSLLPRMVEGMEWGDAVATVVSLDVDLEEAAAVVAAAIDA
mgnify:CR=1 FL=1